MIHDSTNSWYQSNRSMDIFRSGPESTLLFCKVYEALDPDCCLIAKAKDSGQIVGSCFYHPRKTHFSLGIMNVHPAAFGKGIARHLLNQIIDLAMQRNLPVRLVSSAMNLDSYSLYTRAGFVPRQTYQDMLIEIPAAGIADHSVDIDGIRDANYTDIHSMLNLEMKVAGITREKDYRYFVKNESGDWHVSVLERDGEMLGWIVSIAHPASNMIGPCIAVDQKAATALLFSEINYRAGQTMVFLSPVQADKLVKTAYRWGAKNCELHVAQVLGDFRPFNGISMPTFMPETA